MKKKWTLFLAAVQIISKLNCILILTTSSIWLKRYLNQILSKTPNYTKIMLNFKKALLIIGHVA